MTKYALLCAHLLSTVVPFLTLNAHVVNAHHILFLRALQRVICLVFPSRDNQTTFTLNVKQNLSIWVAPCQFLSSRNACASLLVLL